METSSSLELVGAGCNRHRRSAPFAKASCHDIAPKSDLGLDRIAPTLDHVSIGADPPVGLTKRSVRFNPRSRDLVRRSSRIAQFELTNASACGYSSWRSAPRSPVWKYQTDPERSTTSCPDTTRERALQRQQLLRCGGGPLRQSHRTREILPRRRAACVGLQRWTRPSARRQAWLRQAALGRCACDQRRGVHIATCRTSRRPYCDRAIC